MNTITHYGCFRKDVPNSPMIKDAGFFVSQGGLTKDWGTYWKPVFDATSIGDARRKVAMEHGVELSPIYSGEE